MTNLQLEAVTVDFPIYNASTRSLKNSLLHRGTGGRIARDTGNRMCVRALEDVSLALEHGDRVGLIGHNGAGKTTLLRVLAGIYQPTLGQVRRQGRVASLFDISLGIDSESTGYENIMLCGMFLGLTPEEVRERTDEIAAFTELGDFLAMPVCTYSTGMMLRLAFAISTCVQPEILLMDEWIAAGDAQFLSKAEQRMNAIVDSSSILVIASHSEDLITRLCTKAAFLEEGRVRAFGPVGDVLEAYKQSE